MVHTRLAVCPPRPPALGCRRSRPVILWSARAGTDQCRLLGKSIAPSGQLRRRQIAEPDLAKRRQDQLGGALLCLAAGRLVDLEVSNIRGHRVGHGQDAERPVLAGAMALPDLLARFGVR